MCTFFLDSPGFKLAYNSTLVYMWDVIGGTRCYWGWWAQDPGRWRVCVGLRLGEL